MGDFVEHIGDCSIRVVALSLAAVQIVEGLGGTRGVGVDAWRIDYDDEDQLALILQRLRDSDFAFSGGSSGWQPGEIAEYLREKGKLRGVINAIVYVGPGQATMQDR